jgi:hypothetical protein
LVDPRCRSIDDDRSGVAVAEVDQHHAHRFAPGEAHMYASSAPAHPHAVALAPNSLDT